MRSNRLFETFFLIAFLGFGSPSIVVGHNPSNSSILLMEGKGNKWILQINAALTAFEFEVHNEYSADSYKTPEEFNALVAQLMRKSIGLSVNGKAVELSNPVVKLGHETVVVFQVTGIPDRIQSLEMKNSSFEHITRNQSAFILLKEGFAADQFVLDSNNEHTAELQASNGKFGLIEHSKVNTQYILWTLGVILLVLLAGVSFYKRRNLKWITRNEKANSPFRRNLIVADHQGS